MGGTKYCALYREQRIDAETDSKSKDGKTWNGVFTRSCSYGDERQRGCLELRERVRERAGTEREGVCCSEGLSVEMLKRFRSAMEERRQQSCDNNTSRPCIDKSWKKGLSAGGPWPRGSETKAPFDNGVYCQRRGCTKTTCEIFGQDDGDAVQDGTHL
jgi:hypothetical protein